MAAERPCRVTPPPDAAADDVAPPQESLRAADGRIALDAFMPYLMNRLIGRLNHNLGDLLRRHDMTFQHWRVFLALSMRGRRTLGELCDDTMVPQSTLSRVVMRMEDAGLVTRTPDDRDTRVVWVDLTAAGHAAFDAVYPEAWAEYRRTADVLSAKEEETLIRLLRRMIDGAR